MGRGVSLSISAPSSASTSAESALMEVPGFVPAECTATRSPAALRMSPAAIWDLPPLRTQTNSTDGVLIGWILRRR
jgi:hypothetical protein